MKHGILQWMMPCRGVNIKRMQAARIAVYDPCLHIAKPPPRFTQLPVVGALLEFRVALLSAEELVSLPRVQLTRADAEKLLARPDVCRVADEDFFNRLVDMNKVPALIACDPVPLFSFSADQQILRIEYVTQNTSGHILRCEEIFENAVFKNYWSMRADLLARDPKQDVENVAVFRGWVSEVLDLALNLCALSQFYPAYILSNLLDEHIEEVRALERESAPPSANEADEGTDEIAIEEYKTHMVRLLINDLLQIWEQVTEGEHEDVHGQIKTLALKLGSLLLNPFLADHLTDLCQRIERAKAEQRDGDVSAQVSDPVADASLDPDPSGLEPRFSQMVVFGKLLKFQVKPIRVSELKRMDGVQISAQDAQRLCLMADPALLGEIKAKIQILGSYRGIWGIEASPFVRVNSSGQSLGVTYVCFDSDAKLLRCTETYDFDALRGYHFFTKELPKRDAEDELERFDVFRAEVNQALDCCHKLWLLGQFEMARYLTLVLTQFIDELRDAEAGEMDSPEIKGLGRFLTDELAIEEYKVGLMYYLQVDLMRMDACVQTGNFSQAVQILDTLLVKLGSKLINLDIIKPLTRYRDELEILVRNTAAK